MKGMSVKSGHKRPTKSGAGMTQKGVAAYRRRNPGSKLKTAVTGKSEERIEGCEEEKELLCKKCWSNEEVSKGRKRSKQQIETSTKTLEVLI